MRRFLHTVRTVLKGKSSTYTLVEELREPYNKSVVHLALNEAQEKCIVKTSTAVVKIQNEYDILSRYQHQTPHIRHFIERLEDVDDMQSLALKYLDNDLRQESMKRRLSRAEIKQVAKSVLQVLKLLHKDGLVHADLKLDNVLVNYGTDQRFSSIQIGDFDVVVSQESERAKKGRICGAAYARSPEMLLQEPWGMPSDIWSFGNMIIALVYGGDFHLFMPSKADNVKLGEPEYEATVLKRMYRFFGPFPESLFNAVDEHNKTLINHFHTEIRCDRPFTRITKREVPPADLAFLLKIMKLDPAARPTAEQLLDDEWFTEESEDTRSPLPI